MENTLKKIDNRLYAGRPSAVFDIDNIESCGIQCIINLGKNDLSGNIRESLERRNVHIYNFSLPSTKSDSGPILAEVVYVINYYIKANKPVALCDYTNSLSGDSYYTAIAYMTVKFILNNKNLNESPAKKVLSYVESVLKTKQLFSRDDIRDIDKFASKYIILSSRLEQNS